MHYIFLFSDKLFMGQVGCKDHLVLPSLWAFLTLLVVRVPIFVDEPERWACVGGKVKSSARIFHLIQSGHDAFSRCANAFERH